MTISFEGNSFFNYTSGLSPNYVANPDGTLRVSGTRKGSRTLGYYYCDVPLHSTIGICNQETYDPDRYIYLKIENGTLEGQKETEQIVFPVDSPWEIWRKRRLSDPPEINGVLIMSGFLEEPVIYKETIVD